MAKHLCNTGQARWQSM